MKDTIIGGVIFAGVLGFAALSIFIPPEDTATPPTQQVQSVETAPTETLTAQESDYVAENGTSDCTSDCSGHDAGYEWAEEKGICDPEFDGGNSESFAEGVREYAYDNCYYGDDSGPY
jgi:hypothetical protein